MTLHDRVLQSSDFVRNRLRDARAAEARVAIVLGSGLGSVTDQLAVRIELPYADIPYLPATAVEGHRGRLLAGLLGGEPALIFEGRIHGYEGYTPEETTFTIRVMAALEINTLIVTNAAGAIRESFGNGELVAIADHINLTGVNAAAGPHEEQLGPRFFDMSRAYDPALRALAQDTASQQGWQMAEGVYLGVQGPSFETPAEIRAFRTLGADLVGMSTVHEVIVARQCGLRVLGISCVTNMAAGVLDQPLQHGEVMATGAAASLQLGTLLSALMPRLSEGAN
jgi:purine-nucleoside phosphorylase